MTSDLKTQVREYTEFFVSTVEPVGLNEILDHLVGDEGVQPIGPMVADRPRGLRVALLAAAVILIVVGGVTWLIRFGGDVEPVEEPSVTTTLGEEPSTTTSVPQATPGDLAEAKTEFLMMGKAQGKTTNLAENALRAVQESAEEDLRLGPR